MALPQRYIEKDPYTEDEYFAFEADAFGRWEYVRGEIRLMAGRTPDHSAVAANLITALNNALRGVGNRTCRVFTSDLKGHTGDGVNTLLLAEVLSPSTGDYDRGDKWASYQTIPALQHYLLLAADRPRVEVYTRDEPGWRLLTSEGLTTQISLPALGVPLALADLYDLVEFDGVNAGP